MSYSKSLYPLSLNIVKLLCTQKALYFIGLAVILDAIFNFYDSFCINFIIQSIRHLKVISFSSKILSEAPICTGRVKNPKNFNIRRHLGRHLEFLKLLKDDKVSSIGFLK